MPPSELLAYIQDHQVESFKYRRRAVLTRSGVSGDWRLVCCTIESVFDESEVAPKEPTRIYDLAVLYEDWLSPVECQSFVNDVQGGHLLFGDIALKRALAPTWSSEFVSANSRFMRSVGFVASTRFEHSQLDFSSEPLVDPRFPYYPDTTTALADWLPFPKYSGQSDGNNQSVLFLLAEARAFFTSIESDSGVLTLHVDGTETEIHDLLVKGMYVAEGVLTHFEGPIRGDLVSFDVPDEVDRFECVLLDTSGTVFDLQREMWGQTPGLLRKRVGASNDSQADAVRIACEGGETELVEFKPFVELDRKTGPVDANTKFREVLRTIAAFANTKGGSIFIGVDDTCRPLGIQQKLAEWGHCEVDDKLVQRYKGALTQKLRGELLGDVHFETSFVTVDDALISVVRVAPRDGVPVAIRNDGHFYVRRGSSNKHLEPHEWPVMDERPGSLITSWNPPNGG